jgi:hypothetical protein
VSSFFPYEVDPRFSLLLRGAGLRPSRHGVTITDDGRLVATFSMFRVDTPVANVAGAHVTRDYRWWTAIGVRASLADDGITFGTNNHAGVCVHFHEKVKRVIGFRDHSALTVTVADVDGLAAALAAGQPNSTGTS